MATSFRFAAPGKSTRRWLAGVTALALLTLGIPLGLNPANAAAPSGAYFEIDGNTALDGTAGTQPLEDWNELAKGQTTAPVKQSLGTAGDKLLRTLSSTVDNTTSTGQDVTVFGSNNKEEPPGGAQWPNWAYTNNGNATGKSDFGFVSTYSWVQKSTNDIYLAFAFDRGFGTGTSTYYFELNQKIQGDLTIGKLTRPNPNPDRTKGDVRLTIEDQGNGTIVTTAVDVWSADGTAGKWVSSGIGDYVIKSNSGGDLSNLPTWWKSWNAPGGTIPKDSFVEGVFNLSTFDGIKLDCPSAGFAAFNARSVTGNSDKNLVDYIKAQAINVPSSCATLTVQKSGANGTALPGTQIAISPNPLPGGGADPYIVTTGADGTFTIPEVKPGTYTVSEYQAPLGYIKVADPQTVKLDNFGNATVSFVDPLGDVAWTKSYEGYTTQNSYPGDFTGATFQVTRADNAVPARDISNSQFAAISGITATGCPTACTFTVRDNSSLDKDGDWGKIRVNNLPIGVYTITETTAPVGFAKDTGSAKAEVPVELENADIVNGKVVNHLVTAARQGTSSGSETFNNPRNTGKIAVAKTSLATGEAVSGAKFQLYRVVGQFDPTSDPKETDDVALPNLGTYVTAPATVSNLAWGESYYFVEVSAPAPYNVPDKNWTSAYTITAADADKGTVAATLTIADPQTKITTSATPEASLPSAKISDSATVTGLNSKANGTVTFKLYYSADLVLGTADKPSTVCTTDNLVAYTSSVKIGSGTAYPVKADGSVTVPSKVYTAVQAGYYYWVASYAGDGFNSPASGYCGDALEVSHVVPPVSGIVTFAGGDKALGSGTTGATIYDEAKLTGLSGPDATGKITFKVYLNSCSTTALDTFVVDIAGKVQGDSATGYFVEVSSADDRAFVVTKAGTYIWAASFAPADENNTPSAEVCGARAQESWKVDKATPALVTDTRLDKSQDLTLPSTSVTDTATVTGLTSDAKGDVTFELYAATDTTCAAAPIFTSKVAIDGKVDSTGKVVVTSAPYTGIVAAGTYKWIATYGGDANNNATPRPACGLVNETNHEITVIEKANPVIVTSATGGQFAAGSTSVTISDTALVTNLSANAGGTVTFSVYGPYPTAAAAMKCDVDADPLAGSVTVDLTGSGSQPGTASVTADVKVSTAGFYAWQAVYSGDANNNGASHVCGKVDETFNEVSEVKQTTPTLETTATQEAVLGLDGEPVNISDEATFAGLTANATGAVWFEVFGPDDAECSSDTPSTVTGLDMKDFVQKDGSAVIPSTGVPVSEPGTYRWIAHYAGDANNPALDGACNDRGESTLVTQAKPGLSKVAKDAEGTIISGTVPAGEGTKELIGRVDLDDPITYVVTVSNTGTAEATGPVTDTLPLGLGKPTGISLDSKGAAATVTQLPAGNWQITWNSITVGVDSDPLELTYTAVVLRDPANPDLPVNATLTNTATWLGLQDSTTTLVKYLTVTAEPFCDANTPKVTYTVTPFNLDPSIENWTTDLTFLTPQGATIDPSLTTINGQPQSLVDQQLTGTLLYPGTKVVNGVTVDWPGWKNTGTDAAPVWVVDGDGLTPAVKLQATVNPTGTSVVIYPAAAAPCAPPGVPSFTKTSPTAVGSTARPSGNVVTGEKVHYVLTLTNNGGQSVTAPLTDTLPDGVTNPTAFTVSPSAGFTATPTVTGQKLDWGNVTVAAGQTVKYEFDVTVSAKPDPGQITDLVNNAAWGALPGQTRHIVAGPGVEIVPTLSKTADPKTGSVVKVGDVITYTVKVGNNGNVALTGDLVDTLPKGIEVVGNYTRDDGGKAEPDTATTSTLTWKDVTVQPGQVVTFTYEIKVLDSAQDQDSLVNTAEWLGIKGGTEHTVSVPSLPVTGGGSDPLTTVGWAGALLVLGLVFLLWGRRRDEQA